MTELESFGQDLVSDRSLYLLELDASADLPPILSFHGRHFVCLLAWDATRVEDSVVADLARRLLEAGGAYFCVFGRDCERVHDIIDQVAVPLSPKDSVVMTTWHGDESLGEALFYFLRVTWPDERYEATTRAGIAIVVGQPDWAAEVRKAFQDPDEFTSRACEEGDR